MRSDQGAQAGQGGSAGSSSGSRRRAGPSALSAALGASVEIEELTRQYPYMDIAMQSLLENHHKTHTTLREVLDQVARWVRESNPAAPARRGSSRGGAQVAARHREQVEGLRGDLAHARRERDEAIEQRNRARWELEDERRARDGRRGRRRGRDDRDSSEERSRSRRRYDRDERDRRDGRWGGRSTRR